MVLNGWLVTTGRLLDPKLHDAYVMKTNRTVPFPETRGSLRDNPED